MTSVLASRRILVLLVLLVTFACLLLLARAAHGASGAPPLPLSFEINRGQRAPEVKFSAHGPERSVFLTSTDAVFVLRGAVVRMSFPGANATAMVSGVDELPGHANYFRGRDPAMWRTDIPTFARVLYRDLFPGVDLAFYGNQRQLEYDFIIAPSADASRIAMRFEGVEGISIAADGDLVLRLAGGAGELRQHAPVVYQQVGDARQTVDGRYVLRGGTDGREGKTPLIGFEIGAYDRTRPLIIDPVLAFSSYLGGSGADLGERIAVDFLGSAYLTGSTTSPDFPTTTGPSLASALEDVFVTKLNPQGSALVYSTYIGGVGADFGRDIAVDFAGQAYLTGFTNSTDFPIVNALQSVYGGGQNDAFVLKLGADGDALVYSTYLGGSRSDVGRGLAIDLQGNAYVTGETSSTNFPTTAGSFQPVIAGEFPDDAFVTKLSADGGSLVYSTFLGGLEPDTGIAIAVNLRGNAYVTGVTAGDFPAVRPFQPTQARGAAEAFVTKFSEDGSSLVWSSDLGGNRVDAGLDIAVDLADRAVVVGTTMSTDFPVKRPLQPSRTDDRFHGFVTIISPSGTSIVLSSYIGGTSSDQATGVALDLAGNVYITGWTTSTDFPVVNPIQATHGGGPDFGTDAFVVKIDPRPGRIVYSTFLGGEANDEAHGIAVDLIGSAYVIGRTVSDHFPVVNALQPTRAGDVDAFFTKITPQP
jgi:hypothetical protein